MSDIKLLDCTLRDGGYVNDWKWGTNRAKSIINKLADARIDMVEVGFLRNSPAYNPDYTISNRISDLNSLVEKSDKTVFSAMAMRSNYDISQLGDYCGSGIELIRVTAHDYDISEIYEYADIIQKKGYKVSINPINIMGYTEDEILDIIEHVNAIRPYQFCIVDTFGSMTRTRLRQIVDLVNNNLDDSIRLGLHLHENMAQTYSMAQDFLDMRIARPITIDASLMGMGRTPGNLALELICDYVNTYYDKSYDLDYILDAIYDYIYPLRGDILWGYTPEYFLSGKYNLHRNYAEYYLKKGDLTTKDVNHILSRIERQKASVYDQIYAEQKYVEYKTNTICDTDSLEKLKEDIGEKSVLVVAPGASLNIFGQKITEYVKRKRPVVISLNFEPQSICADMAFFSNNKRYANAARTCRHILTSNIPINEKVDYYFDYNSLSGAFKQGCNSFILLLKLLKKVGVKEIAAVGADGYKQTDNYYDSALREYTIHDSEFNKEVTRAIELLDVKVRFLTPTEYGESEWK